MLRSRTMLAALVLAGLATLVYSAQADPHQSVASDASPPPPLETTPGRIEPFRGKRALYQPPTALSEDELARIIPPGAFERAARIQQVIGDDDRVRIASPNPYPERAVVHLTTSSQGCTGWLIGSDTVITAGHCVHNGSQFTPLAGIVVASSIEGDKGPPPMFTTPFPVCGAKRLYSTAGWTSKLDEAFDYGAIKLDCKLGDLVGWLGAGDQPSPAGKPGRIVGYDSNTQSSECDVPGNFRNLCAAVGGAMTISGTQLFYDTDVEAGGSGSPVLIPTAPTFAVAIHGWGAGHMRVPPHDKFNHGVLITKRVFQNLLAWSKATPR
jgi:glutamyl endopeptidase